MASVGCRASKRQPLPHGRGSGSGSGIFCHVLHGSLRSFTVALLYSCLLLLRGLSLLRFAGRSPLPDGGHKEEAGIRFFGGERSGDGLLSATHPVPRDRRGWGWRSGLPILSPEAACGDSPTWGEQRETVPGSCRAVRWTILPVVHSHCTGRVKWRAAGWAWTCVQAASARRPTRPARRRAPLGAVLSAECRNSRRRPPGRRCVGAPPRANLPPLRVLAASTVSVGRERPLSEPPAARCRIGGNSDREAPWHKTVPGETSSERVLAAR